MPRFTLLAPALVLTLAGAMASPARAQHHVPNDSTPDTRHFSFYDHGPYRASVPRPDSLLGYAIGDKNTQYAQQQEVLLAIAAAASDRVRVEEFGRTNEGRPMRAFIVSSPENIARLDAIRADLDKIGDPRTAGGDVDAIAARTPAVVWLNESIHGNESPGFEAGMQTLYQLAASDEPATVEALKHVILVLSPSANPDGHERFTVWYNSINVADPDNDAVEHNEPWSIQGRFNHYRFDMNRDADASTQREVRATIHEMLRWHPMVSMDQHGQVATYFFPPAARPLNANLGPDAAKWLEIIGAGNAAAFDQYGWMYYSRDQFDLYAPFYWDTWPGLNGATGMTYESDGGGWKGIEWRRDDGSLLSFRDGIAKHYVSAITTIETTAAHAQDRVRDYAKFRQSAIADGRTAAMKRVVIVPGKDPATAAELAATLIRSGIEVRQATAAFSSSKAHAYYDDATGAHQFPAGSYVVDLAQPQGRLAKSILEPVHQLDPVFARNQLDKARRNIRRGRDEQQEGYEFYDVTSFSLPVAFGTEAYWTEDATPAGGAPLTVSFDADLDTVRTMRVGGELLPVDIGGGIVAGRGARSTYLFPSERSGAARLAYHLLASGFIVSIATQDMDAGGTHWARGTYVVRVARNDSTLPARLDSLARADGVAVTGVNSAFTSQAAQWGTGSESVAGLKTPKIAIVADEGISQTSYGALWWDFEQRFHMHFTPISLSRLNGGDIDAFNVIIIPDASSGALNRRLGKDGADRLRQWATRGNVLITMGGASEWAARDNVNLTSARALEADTSGADSAALKKLPSDTLLTSVASPTSSVDVPDYLPGSNFDAELDRTSWLTFGYDRPRMTAMLSGTVFLKPSREGTNVAVFATSGLLNRSGWSWPENTERLLRGKALVIDEPTGDGHVILFANEPMFRGWWRAMDKLVLNAVVLGPSM